MKVLLYGLALLILAANATAIGIGAAPAELEFEVDEGGKQQRELTVYNLKNKDVRFEVKSKADFLEFKHAETIKAHGSSKIVVEANAKNLAAGTHKSTIYASTLNDAEGVMIKIGAAVKATVKVSPSAPSQQSPNVFVGMLVFLTISAACGILTFLTLKIVKK